MARRCWSRVPLADSEAFLHDLQLTWQRAAPTDGLGGGEGHRLAQGGGKGVVPYRRQTEEDTEGHGRAKKQKKSSSSRLDELI